MVKAAPLREPKLLTFSRVMKDARDLTLLHHCSRKVLGWAKDSLERAPKRNRPRAPSGAPVPPGCYRRWRLEMVT